MAPTYPLQYDPHDDIVCDPWHKSAEDGATLPDEVRFACSYELFVAFEWFDEAAFFRRTETTDELWTGSGGCSVNRTSRQGTAYAEPSARATLSDIGCVYAVPRRDQESISCLSLLDRLFRARVGFYWPERLIVAGIIEKSAFDGLVGRLTDEVDDNAREAGARETEIVRAARELGLSPRPSGTGPDHWYANCPGKNHPLYITAAVNSFGCGWCRRKGGVEELRAFVEERSKGGLR